MAGCVVEVWGESHTRTVFFFSVQFCLSASGGDGLVLLVQSRSSPCMECCRESLEPASMRPFHNNIAQNYRVEGASPLWVENSQLATSCPRPPKDGGHDRVGRLTYC